MVDLLFIVVTDNALMSEYEDARVVLLAKAVVRPLGPALDSDQSEWAPLRNRTKPPKSARCCGLRVQFGARMARRRGVQESIRCSVLGERAAMRFSRFPLFG